MAPLKSFLFLLITLALCLETGASEFGLWDYLSLRYFSPQPSATELDLMATIILDIRLPRVLAGCVCGAALAAAGVLSQGLFRNSLAAPSIMGVSAGASLGTALVILFFGASLWWLTPIGAVGGGILATTLALTLSASRSSTSVERLLLAGFALNTLLSALTSLIVAIVLDDFEKGTALMRWLLGSFNGISWEPLTIVSIPLALAAIYGYICTKPLDILSLGENVAITLGLELKSVRIRTVATFSILVGFAVSIGGTLPFIGLMVPHWTRLRIGPQHGPLYLTSMMNGATFLCLMDLIVSVITLPSELPVGVLVALIGSPFFLYLLAARSRGADC